MNIETIPLEAFSRPPRNVRVHPDAQIAEMMRSVEMFGQIRPLVIDEDNTVWAGNGLLTALQRLGRETAQALRVNGLSADAKTKLMLADNKVYTLGHDDYDAIMGLIRDLGDLDIPGFDADLLSSLVSNDVNTAEVLNDFGRMTEQDKAARSAPVRAVRTEGENRVVCPHCGKDFLIQ